MFDWTDTLVTEPDTGLGAATPLRFQTSTNPTPPGRGLFAPFLSLFSQAGRAARNAASSPITARALSLPGQVVPFIAPQASGGGSGILEALGDFLGRNGETLAKVLGGALPGQAAQASTPIILLPQSFQPPPAAPQASVPSGVNNPVFWALAGLGAVILLRK